MHWQKFCSPLECSIDTCMDAKHCMTSLVNGCWGTHLKPKWGFSNTSVTKDQKIPGFFWFIHDKIPVKAFEFSKDVLSTWLVSLAVCEHLAVQNVAWSAKPKACDWEIIAILGSYESPNVERCQSFQGCQKFKHDILSNATFMHEKF